MFLLVFLFNRRTFYASTYFLCLFLLGCKKNPNEIFDYHDQMVLVYMAANNDLQPDAIDCLNRMEAGFQGKDNLLVYIKTTSNNSYILKIKHDDTEKVISDTLMVYGDENSSNPEFFSRVIKDARELSPATSYGLILWSHASSWAPSANIRLKSFGQDRGTDMDLIDLKNALPDDFSYIIFDACSMASIEAIFELRNKAQYIMASPTEVLSTSYPYEQILPYLFQGESGLKVVGEKFINYYKALKGDYASATVSLVSTKKLEVLAQQTKILLDSKTFTDDFNRSEIQRLDFDPAARVPAYDFLDFLAHNFQTEEYASIVEQLEKIVIFKDNTSNFLNNPIKKFSGISIYLPEVEDSYQSYYSTLDWYQKSGAYNLF